ncbi:MULTISPECIES: sigma-70 family RNA polymerase sigma factor [Pontibacillus]|uniref:RNA polymerase factor sigma C n=1 Tax=Pontibacillus marinus BH030004 = DSM 16465 TaxID=1385511 RepID=A0A0A5FWG1_9BACI|nr:MULTISPECIES: sigma-70 family RNA polymerase sigma factor [Pontibacillus]KGX83363.1 hypothetical protein N783_04355 [Pontibacillus marinus BH030004 = DSM 16465]QHE50881.1 sigma-70 family RNA polymerase sigma factor [Pontibacillus sp. HMF3514]QHE52757.1 sigma-70 family RNA polymerase sigma factor [Pontibacillus sp. HMF3514]
MEDDHTYQDILKDLMEKYGDMVLRVAFTYVKEEKLAEDLSQEIFIRCYKSLHNFDNRSSYKTWLYRITVNYCKDYVRSWAFRKLIPKSMTKVEYEHNMRSVATEVLEKEESEELFHKVLRLSVKLREVIILYYYEELTVDEISDVLDVNSNTVKSRLHRARRNLKEYMKGGMVLGE